ncbi:MAG: TonB-dependent receptor plug domain-containing protein [Pseudomonadales bacterium]
MSKFPFRPATRLACAVAATIGVHTSSISAQEEVIIEETVTVGTRGKPRSATDSPAPVDVFGGSDFSNQGDTDVNNLLRNAVPSYNVNDQPISDAATLVRPANLRGLAPDHTLILVNGKRRHRASVITWLGNGISNGSQGPDTAAIPALALKTVEVLRDGAAAQYGSDAIAGVMNFNLKDANEGGTIEVRYGQFSEGDGESVTIAGNVGLPLGDSGFINITAEYGNSDDTSRSEQRADAQSLIDAGYQGVPAPAMIWGLPIVDDNIKLWANFGFDLGEGTEIYGHTNYNSKSVDGGFFYRNPTNRGAVYSNDGGETLLIGDLTPGAGTTCPTVGFEADGVTPDANFAQVVADPECFSFQETIPGGFTPRFGGDVTDMSFLAGVRGETDSGLLWDISAYYGNHESDFFINNTVNASLGPNTPRDFDPGSYEQTDTNLNADFSYAISETVNLGFGAEYRVEEFTIGAGQVESFTAGPLADQGFSTSSNGFPGFPQVTSGSFDRSNYAAYVDAEWDATDDLLVQAAVRFEDFEDFGTTTNFKLGANYHVTDNFGVRATYATGFKAPTPGQSNASNTSTELTGGVLVNNGTIPATNPVALANGSRPLEPEDSTSIALGMFFNVGNFDVTIDYFNIDVEDRLNLSSEVVLSAAQIAQLVADGVPGAGDLTQFRFFSNDFDTNTSGVDIIVSTSTEWLGGTTDWNLAFNHTKTDVERFNPDTIGPLRLRQIEETTPDTRWNLSANHNIGAFRVLARVSFYDEWFDSFENDVFGSDAVFDSEYIVDLEAAYDINEQSSILIGANNVFDNNGQKATDVNNLGSNSALVLGNTYSQYSPFGISGAYWYARYQYNF